MAKMELVEAEGQYVNVLFDGVLQVFRRDIIVQSPPYETVDERVRFFALQ